MAIPLQIDGLTVRYGDHIALDGVTATIPQGTSVAVIGPNGSGKSTLLKTLAGVHRPAGGSIEHGDATMALVLQSTDVDPSMPLSVRDTVTMSRFAGAGLLGRLSHGDRDAVNNAMAALELTDLADRQIHRLSGGQRQRAFVAQGLAQEADILLLDEPLTGLDVVSRALIATALDNARMAGRTVMLTTHSFTEAEECELIMLLATRCLAIGPPDEVLTEANLRAAFGGRFTRVGNTLVLDDPHHQPAG